MRAGFLKHRLTKKYIFKYGNCVIPTVGYLELLKFWNSEIYEILYYFWYWETVGISMLYHVFKLEIPALANYNAVFRTALGTPGL